MLWDTATGQAERSLAGHVGRVIGVVFSSDGKTLVSGGYDGTVHLWSVTTGRRLRTVGDGQVPIRSVALSPDGSMLACGCGDGTVRLFRWS